MPTIEFSQNFIQGQNIDNAMARVIGYWNPVFDSAYDNGSNLALTGLLAISANNSTAALTSNIYIMKGTVPTSLTSTSLASRSADILCSFTNEWQSTASNPANFTFGPTRTTVGLNPAVITTNYVAASASGTATWFWMLCRAYRADTIYQQAAGTIGLPGSGADLEIPSTTITSGQLLRVSNLRLRLPTSYVY